jgi:hypothetical protein
MITWAFAFWERRPVLYGEGAVANAARLARDGIAYTDVDASSFVAANYPPLYLHLASIGDPFVSGRLASIAATLLVAGVVFWLARPAGVIAAAALAAGWIALAPVAIWGPVLKPDLLALALTVIAVVTLDRRRDLAAVAGFALVFAAFAKPTALLPAFALTGWLVWRDRTALARYGFGVAVGVVAAAVTVYLDSVPDVWRHVVTWNALSWSAEQAALIVVLGIVVIGVPAAIAVLARATVGARGAYLAGAIGVALLGGREGATINYLLDLTAAVMLSLASIAPRLRLGALMPVGLLVQLLIGTYALNPLSVVPGRPPSTGAWSDPQKGTGFALYVFGDTRVLAEDSALLVTRGIAPVVDDLFLWSRLVDRGVIDAEPILRQIRDGRIGSVVAETDLEHLEAAPAFERQRWSDALVRAVLDRYRLATRAGPLWIYEPR